MKVFKVITQEVLYILLNMFVCMLVCLYTVYLLIMIVKRQSYFSKILANKLEKITDAIVISGETILLISKT